MGRKEGFHWNRGPWWPSARQRQVLNELLADKTNAQIAELLGVSPAAVRWQISEMLGETGLDDRQALAAWWTKERARDRQPAITPLVSLSPVFKRLRSMRWRLGLAGGTAGVGVIAVVFGLLIMSTRERSPGDETGIFAGLDIGVYEGSTATPEPERTDLSALDAIALRWKQWSDSAGAWNADVVRGGTTNPSPPLSLGYGVMPPVSPDGRLIAHSDRKSGEVTVYDLAAWEPVMMAKTAPDVFPLVWSNDSSQVYGWREHCDQPADRGVCPSGLQRDLWRVDVTGGTAERVAVFDFSAMSVALEPWRDARRAYVLGVDTDICCAIDPVGGPFLAVIDMASRSLVRKVPLPGLLAGQLDYGLEDGGAASFYPEIVLSPDGARLFVADAASNSVLVMNTRTFAVERLEPREKRSALSRFGRWAVSRFVSTAEAKGGGAFYRYAEITPDGRYLIVGGSSMRKVTRKNGADEWVQRPAGVMVVNTQNMEIELRDEEVMLFQSSPDGRWLLTYGSYYDEELGVDPQGGGVVALGLSVFDLESMKLVQHLWPGEQVQLKVFSPDGGRVFVTSHGPDMTSAVRAGIGCNGDCFRLNLLDLANGSILWRGRLAENEDVLAFPPP